jgi:hypothetical protein
MNQFLKPNKNKIIIFLILLSPFIITLIVDSEIALIFFLPLIGFSVFVHQFLGDIGGLLFYYLSYVIYICGLYFISCLIDSFVNKISGKSKKNSINKL